MKTPAKVALLIMVCLCVVAAMVHFFSPHGLPALVEKWFPPAPRTARPRTPSAAPSAAAPTGDSLLRQAELTYDAGDFDQAVDLFKKARAEADAGLRDRATRGLHKAILAWGLTTHVAAPTPLPEDPQADVARRQAAAEAAQSERAWYDATVFAAGVGAWKKLPYLAQMTMASALPRGPVEERLERVLVWAGPRAPLLREAMTDVDLLQPVDPVTSAAEPPRPPTKPRVPVTSTLQVPGGRFSASMKARLETAVDLERKGTAEYELSGPDEPKRKEHRKAALDYLVKARDIYEAALEEDSHSSSLDRHVRDVMEMLSHLRKETNLGE